MTSPIGPGLGRSVPADEQVGPQRVAPEAFAELLAEMLSEAGIEASAANGVVISRATYEHWHRVTRDAIAAWDAGRRAKGAAQ